MSAHETDLPASAAKLFFMCVSDLESMFAVILGLFFWVFRTCRNECFY